jgi:hypothetical protein
LYDKLDARKTQTRDIKVNSSFRSYITEQRKRIMQVLKLRKSQVEKANSSEIIKESYKDESKLYIGVENFPLSIYERSKFYFLIIEFGNSKLVSSSALEVLHEIIKEKFPKTEKCKYSKYIAGFDKCSYEYGVIICGILYY